MATDHTEKLIVDLVADLSPVQRLAPVSIRMMRWLAVAVVTGAAAVWIIGVRADVSRAMATPAVLLLLGLAVATCGSAAAVALRLSVPGAGQSVWLRALPVATVAVWVAALVLLARNGGTSWPALVHEPFHAACIARVVAIALLPSFFLAREVRRGFALDAVSATALAALGGSALAAVAVQLVCPIDRPAHLLISHVLPALALVLAGAAAARVRPRLVSHRLV
jgi:hypothetical protein